MQEYAALPFGEHMRFLIDALDGDVDGVPPPGLQPLSTEVDAEILQEATAYLRRTHVAIEARKRWPDGGLPTYGLRGNIPGDRQAQGGMALCLWGDAGWGTLVRKGKYEDGRFADELVEACATLVHEWSPQPEPAWVTAVPSINHPDLVPDFARRLASALRLPIHMVLSKTDARLPQKDMNNSAQQARNVDGSLGVASASVLAGPVLLVDDMVDSRWTMTVAAWMLLNAGSGPVHFLALAQSSGDE